MMLRNYITVAVRNLVRHRFYSAITVIGLAIGMACFVMITLFVQYETRFDGQHEKADRIYRLNFRSGDRWSAMAPLLKDAFPGIVSYVRTFGAEDVLVQSPDLSVYEDVMYADPNLFEVFDIALSEGGEGLLADPSSLVLTKSSAQKYFGTDQVVGRTLRVWDRDHVVTGVVDNVPDNSTLDFDLLAPRSALEGVRTDLNSWCCSNYPTYALMSEGADVAPVEEGYEALMLGRGAQPDRATAKQTVTSDFPVPYADDPDTPDIEKTRIEGGVMSISEFERTFEEDAVLTSRLELFSNLKGFDQIDMKWENLLTLKVTSLINVTLTVDLVYDKDTTDDLQIKEILGVGLSYSFL